MKTLYELENAGKENKLTFYAKRNTRYCGTPDSEYVSKINDDGSKSKSKICKNCEPLKRRDCIKCDSEFLPGCGSKFTCIPCLIKNRSNNYLAYNVKIFKNQ